MGTCTEYGVRSALQRTPPSSSWSAGQPPSLGPSDWRTAQHSQLRLAAAGQRAAAPLYVQCSAVQLARAHMHACARHRQAWPSLAASSLCGGAAAVSAQIEPSKAVAATANQPLPAPPVSPLGQAKTCKPASSSPASGSMACAFALTYASPCNDGEPSVFPLSPSRHDRSVNGVQCVA